MESFQDCITFHLLDMFPSNAAKEQHFYISNMLKKPQQVPVRYFFQRVEMAISRTYLAPITALVQLLQLSPFKPSKRLN
jgi:hypothetical protein